MRQMIVRTASALTLAALLSSCNANAPAEHAAGMSAPTPAQLVEHTNFPSDHVQPRNLSIYLPAGYSADGDETYPVIYAHDGQNLFEPGRSYGGVEWQLDETATALFAGDAVRPAIIVGIWNTNERWQEYAPQKAIERLTGDMASDWLGTELPELKGDAYLRFITQELKPYIDTTYRTQTDAENTLIMGSSMGGLISLYAVAEYPDTFSRAAAVSIHWPLADPGSTISAQADAVMQAYLETSGIDPAKHEIWFDRGTEALDATYAPHAQAMEAWFRAQGWTEDRAIFRDYPGTDHSEGAWADRADQILTFLLAD